MVCTTIMCFRAKRIVYITVRSILTIDFTNITECEWENSKKKTKWKNNGRCNFGTIFRSFLWSELAWFSCFHEFTTMPFSQRPSSNRQSYNRIRFSVSCLDTDAGKNSERKKKKERKKASQREKGNWLKCLPENVAHTVAINVENSTVMAPVSLYAITCVRIINPIAKRPYAPDGIISVILWFYRSNSIKLSCNVCN